MTDLMTILEERGIEFKRTNNPTELLITCSSGLHQDTHPSLQYNLDKNVFHCFSCGFSGGLIKYLQSIGITQKIHIESKQEYKIIKLKRKLRDIKNEDNLILPLARTEVCWEFKGIDKEILSSFNAFVTTDYNLENYICIPVYLFGRLRCIDARRRINDSTLPKYMRVPSVSLSEIVFPLDRIRNTNHVILVEGMYDMLNMWQNGYTDTICIFGANNFNSKKAEVLEKVGITKVTILMDGDEAGRSATRRIETVLEQRDILPTKIYLKEGKDPGDLTKEELEYYFKRNENE